MNTRMIIYDWLVAPTIASACRHAQKIQTEIKTLAHNAYDYVVNPSRAQQEEKILTRHEQYQVAIKPIRERHESRLAIYQARKTKMDSAEQEQLTEYKNQLNDILLQVNKELTGLINFRLPIFYRSQIATKTAEKKSLDRLTCAQTLKEFKLEAIEQKNELERTNNKNNLTYTFLEKLEKQKQILHNISQNDTNKLSLSNA